MTRRIVMVLGGLVVFLAAQVSLAEDTAASTAPTQEAEAAKPARSDRQADRLVKDMELSGETEARFRELFQEYRQAMRDWMEQNAPKFREFHDQWRADEESKDEAKLKELREEMRKLMTSGQESRDNLLKQLVDVLTPDQIEMVKDVVVEWRARAWRTLRSLDLTEEQKAKVREVLKNWSVDMEGEGTPDQRSKAFQSLVEKIVTDALLTDAQQKALAEMTGEESFFYKVKKLDLTETQKLQIEKVEESLSRSYRGPGERGPRRGETQPAATQDANAK